MKAIEPLNSFEHSSKYVLTAETKAGMEVSDIFPHLRAYDLPKLIKISEL